MQYKTASYWSYTLALASMIGCWLIVGFKPFNFSTCQPSSFMITTATLGAIAGFVLLGGATFWAARVHQERKARYLLHVGLRYVLAYSMVYFALLFTEGEHWSLNLTLQDSRIADLSPTDYTKVFLGYSKTLPHLIGGGLLLSACLLAFRRTAILGVLTGLAIWGPLLAVDMTFEQCTLPITAGMVGSLILLSLPYTRRISRSMMGYPVKQGIHFPLLSKQNHLYQSLGVLKLCLIAGVMVHASNGIWHFQKYYQHNDNSPIVGVWDVIDIQYESDTGELRRDTIPLEIATFKSLFLDVSRFGAVKGDKDTLSRFEYIVDSTYNQLEFWNFWEYKDLDLKGKYYLQDQDTLIYEGTNRKEAIRMVLKRNPKYRSE